MPRNISTEEDRLIDDELEVAAMHFAREARASTGLTQRAFAKRAHLSTRTIAGIEANSCSRPPRLSTLAKIARGAGRRLTIGLGE